MKAYMLFLMLTGSLVVYCNMGEPHPLTNLIISNLSPPKPGARFGQKISISFSALEKEWKLNLGVHDDIISSDASIVTLGENDEMIHQTPMHSHVYTSFPGIFPSMRTTLFDDDLMRAELTTKDGSFRIIPLQQFPDQSMISSMTKSKMVMYSVNANVKEMTHQRSLSQSFQSFVTEDWNLCYEGQDKRKIITLGIATDLGFRDRIDTIYGVEPAKKDLYLFPTVQDYVSQVNEVFKAQFNIEFKLSVIEISHNSLSQKWNQRPSISQPNTNPSNGSSLVCENVDTSEPLTTFQQLGYFGDFKSTRYNRATYWSLLTDCQPFAVGGSHLIAAAYSGSLCSPRGAASIVSYVPPEIGGTWTAYAAALGLAFGATMSTNGGIMDNRLGSVNYDPNYQGRIQFSRYERPVMCNLIQSYITAEPPKVNCFEEAPAAQNYSSSTSPSSSSQKDMNQSLPSPSHNNTYQPSSEKDMNQSLPSPSHNNTYQPSSEKDMNQSLPSPSHKNTHQPSSSPSENLDESSNNHPPFIHFIISLLTTFVVVVV